MSKSAETPVPAQSKITVTYRATIPAQQYGNITLEATWEMEVNPAELVEKTSAAFVLLQATIAQQVMPLADAEVTRCTSVLVKETHPDAWMQRNSPPYRWMRVANPTLEIPAMQAIIDSKPVHNTELE